jgi:hypothetical protein
MRPLATLASVIILLNLGLGTAAARNAHTGLFGVAQAGTTFFGGTFWAADSARWEALEDSCWTFDTGVGSDMVGTSLNPDVDPNKANGLHATMEGWTGVDKSFSNVTLFRRLQDTDTWDEICVGAAAGLQGEYSFWCGAFSGELSSACFAGGQGYGNNWNVCIGRSFSYLGGSLTLEYQFVNDTEPGVDFTYVYVDSSGSGDLVEVQKYSGSVGGTESLSLNPGIELPISAGTIAIQFCVVSDGTGSDEDGLYLTDCGAFAVDNIKISGSFTDTTDFETDAGGWAIVPATAGIGGEWSNIVDLVDLPPPLTSCFCNLTDSVLVFDDLSLGSSHGLYQDNLAVSPWIDLQAAGKVGVPGKLIQFDMYAALPVLNYIFVQTEVQWYPELCLSTGKLVTTPFTADGFVRYFGDVPACTPPGGPTRIPFGSIVAPGAEQMRIALGVISYCRFFPNCTGMANSSPWFDNVKLGVFGNPGLPLIGTRTIDTPQDAFPANGTLSANAPGRLDSNNVASLGGPENGLSLGDTLVVQGGADSSEVLVQFSVLPGPGTNPSTFNSWLTSHTFESSSGGLDWYSARMDTAESGGVITFPRAWMTTYHEGDPNFTGSDTATDPFDLDPNGAQTRLLNDIFPDDLFTPGTRVNLFYKARQTGAGSWITFPDTTNLYKLVPPDSPGASPTASGSFYEWECLPSSFDAIDQFNCVLYVDHFSGHGAQPIIEKAMDDVFGSSGSNFDGTAWDRYDVEAPSSQQASFGRPLNTEFGATVIQTLGYEAIIWNSGNLPAFNLSKEDGDILIPWIILQDFDFKNLYLSGNGLIKSAIFEGASEPSAKRFVEDIAGVTINCNTYRNLDCPPGKPQDSIQCVNVDPVTGGLGDATRLAVHTAQGNGCPAHRSFDVLAVNSPDFGVPSPDELYAGNESSPTAIASVKNDAALLGSLSYKIVVDGVSTHYRRDASGPCSFSVPPGTVTSVTERMAEVLGWFGYDTAVTCSDQSTGIGVLPNNPAAPAFPTALLHVSPNPLSSGNRGSIRFTMEREGRAKVQVFDLNGRLVRTVFDGVAREGENETSWNGTDETGRRMGSGVYFYRLRAFDKEIAHKLVLVQGH